jgi:hypothetical protein
MANQITTSHLNTLGGEAFLYKSYVLLVNYPCPTIFDGEIPLFSPT